VLSLAAGASAVSSTGVTADQFYQIVDGKVDPRTYNGFRRYHAGCNHCHRPDGIGSIFAPSLVDRLPDVGAFRRTVRDGKSTGMSVMKRRFADDPNVAQSGSIYQRHLCVFTGACRWRAWPRSTTQIGPMIWS
jgi:hypothetical protein